MERFTAEQEYVLRIIVEEAGAVYCGVQYGGRAPFVVFQPAPGETSLTLYVSALKSPHDVEMAVKAWRDKKEMVRMNAL